MYERYREYIQPQHYRRPESIHGLMHVIRVLYLADKIMDAYSEYLTEQEKKIVALACCYHDIGRVNDDEDPVHGKLSCKKIRELNLLDGHGLTEEEQELVLRLVHYHCLPDEYFDGDEKETFLFHILKDADGLDRVRIFDLDVRYLRLEQSRELVDTAWNLFMFQEGAEF